ncbi:hypothetical protein O3M35_010706 [Rhynocoris fuscipes]|uniref:Transmembrane protein n=1 Tax=Rhynocoris fuscipes TaxID=488301 RepID=A0AAW1D706_9HEMI
MVGIIPPKPKKMKVIEVLAAVFISVAGIFIGGILAKDISVYYARKGSHGEYDDDDDDDDDDDEAEEGDEKERKKLL